MQPIDANSRYRGPVYEPIFVKGSLSQPDIDNAVMATNKCDACKIDVSDLARLTTSWIHKINFHIAHKQKSNKKSDAVMDVM